MLNGVVRRGYKEISRYRLIQELSVIHDIALMIISWLFGDLLRLDDRMAIIWNGKGFLCSRQFGFCALDITGIDPVEKNLIF